MDHIRVCLVETTHGGNIGAVARAMKTMSLGRLYLVSPRNFPSDEAYRRSAGAEEILDRAVISASLLEAIADCGMVIGTTARQRRIPWPILAPREAAGTIVAAALKGVETAIVFGTESSGLDNKQVELCHSLIRIPTASDFASLNLASACQVIAYELFLATQTPADDHRETAEQPADVSQMHGMLAHLRATLEELDFIKTRQPADVLMRKLVRMFNRAQLTAEEINILRGVLSAIQERMPKN